MKKTQLLFISALFAFSVQATEPILIIDFENGFPGTWGTNGNDESGHNPKEDHDAFSIVNNPTKDDINSSNKVAKFHRSITGQWWALAWLDIPAITIEASLAKPLYLHMSIYKPVKSTICVQLKDAMEKPTSNTGEMKNTKQSKINEWQDVVFKLTSNGNYIMMEIKPDFENAVLADRLDDDIDIYIDNIIINGDPTPLGEEPEPQPEYKGHLPEDFEGENTLLDPLFFGERYGVFGQESNAQDFVVVDNPVKSGYNTSNKCARFIRKVSGQWWSGVFMIPLEKIVADVTNKYFHVMVYREIEPTKLSLKLEGDGIGTGDIIAEGKVDGTFAWIDYVFEIPENKYGSYNKVAFMPDFIVDMKPSDFYFEDPSIYFDALELNSNPEPRTNSDISGLTGINFEESLSVWKSGSTIFVNLPQKSLKVTLYNLSGEMVTFQNITSNATVATISTTPLRHGIYLVQVKDNMGKISCAKVIL